MFSKYMRGHTVAVNVRSPEYGGRTNPNWVRGTIETPFLDVSACVGDDGFVNLAVTNVSEDNDYEVDLRGVESGDVEVFTVGGDNVNVVNTEGEQKVGIKEGKWDGQGKYTFAKHSFTLLRWKGA